MENQGMKYEFSAKVCYYSSSEMGGWIFALLPKELAMEIRHNFKFLEEGWGRMKVTAKIGNSEWKTSIWFDTKKELIYFHSKQKLEKNKILDLIKMWKSLFGFNAII